MLEKQTVITRWNCDFFSTRRTRRNMHDRYVFIDYVIIDRRYSIRLRRRIENCTGCFKMQPVQFLYRTRLIISVHNIKKVFTLKKNLGRRGRKNKQQENV